MGLAPPLKKSLTGKRQDGILSLLPLLRSQQQAQQIKYCESKRQSENQKALAVPKFKPCSRSSMKRQGSSISKKEDDPRIGHQLKEQYNWVESRVGSKSVSASECSWSEYMHREWCTFTARRTFTWGGRLSWNLPKFHLGKKRDDSVAHPPLRL